VKSQKPYEIDRIKSGRINDQFCQTELIWYRAVIVRVRNILTTIIS